MSGRVSGGSVCKVLAAAAISGVTLWTGEWWKEMVCLPVSTLQYGFRWVRPKSQQTSQERWLKQWELGRKWTSTCGWFGIRLPLGSAQHLLLCPRASYPLMLLTRTLPTSLLSDTLFAAFVLGRKIEATMCKATPRPALQCIIPVFDIQLREGVLLFAKRHARDVHSSFV